MDQLIGAAASTDWAIVIALLVASAGYSYWKGTGFIISLILAMPIAGFLYTVFPYHEALANFVSPTFEPIVLFFALLLAVLFIMHRTTGFAVGSDKPLHIAGASVILTIMLIGFSYHIVPIEQFYNFGPSFDAFFGSVANFFWVTTIAIFALFVV